MKIELIYSHEEDKIIAVCEGMSYQIEQAEAYLTSCKNGTSRTICSFIAPNIVVYRRMNEIASRLESLGNTSSIRSKTR